MTRQPAASYASADSSESDIAAMAALASLTSDGALLSQAAADASLRAALLESGAAGLSRPLRHSLLSDRAILSHLLHGSIVIQPFALSHLSTSSYDVTLGPHYFRETAPEPGCALYNPYCADMVRRVWGEARLAERHSVYLARTGQPALQGIADDDLLIWIAPGETILAHTIEYIGGRGSVTTMMKARSSMGRNFIEVCKVSAPHSTAQQLPALPRPRAAADLRAMYVCMYVCVSVLSAPAGATSATQTAGRWR